MSALREYFRFLEGVGLITKSPTIGIETPKREKNGRQVLRSDEYTKMLSLAGANPRDYAILQVFLQTGVRVSELAHLRIEDIDFIKPSITVRGKGKQEREREHHSVSFLQQKFRRQHPMRAGTYAPSTNCQGGVESTAREYAL